MKNSIPFHFQRFEIKYFLDQKTSGRIILGLLDYMDWDNYCLPKNNYSYVVSSLYYDSLGYGCYFDKECGVRNRFKLRLRWYEKEIDKDTPIFLEIKRKRDMVIVKDRVLMKNSDCFDILREGKIKEVLNKYSSDEREIIEEFLWLKNFNCMKPKIMVRYNRRALESNIGLDFRITFDFNIKAVSAHWIENTPFKDVIDKNMVLMEVKFNNIMPGWFQTIIQKYQLSRRSFSKYTHSLDVCRRRLLFLI